MYECDGCRVAIVADRNPGFLAPKIVVRARSGPPRSRESQCETLRRDNSPFREVSPSGPGPGSSDTSPSTSGAFPNAGQESLPSEPLLSTSGSAVSGLQDYFGEFAKVFSDGLSNFCAVLRFCFLSRILSDLD